MSERGNEKENVLSEEGPKGIEELKKGGKRRSWEDMKGDDKTDKDRKINDFHSRLDFIRKTWVAHSVKWPG